MEAEFLKQPEGLPTHHMQLFEGLMEQKKELPCQIMWAKNPEVFYLKFIWDDDASCDEMTVLRDHFDQVFQMVDAKGNVKEPVKYLVKPEHLVLGLPVAIYDANDQAFYRAVILKLEGNKCKCYSVDIGCEEWVDLENVCYLPRDALRIECQALQCQLSNVFPPGEFYPDNVGLQMMHLSHSTNREQLLETPLLCKIVKVIKPEPVEYASCWRYHRKILTRLVVELRQPKSDNPICAKPNGFAHLLASLHLCSFTQQYGQKKDTISKKENVVNSKPIAKPQPSFEPVVKKLDPFSLFDPKAKPQFTGRGRGYFTHLPEAQCPDLLFDD